jgi:hypothetical protein
MKHLKRLELEEEVKFFFRVAADIGSRAPLWRQRISFPKCGGRARARKRHG